MKTSLVLPALVLGLFAVSLGAHEASAEAIMNPKTCVVLSTNLHMGMFDSHTDGDISRLQTFLVTQNDFDQANVGTLRFGPMTQKAVKLFQATQSLPVTGYVGPLTRAAIQSVSCGTITPPPSQTVSLYSMNPVSAQVGTTVSLSGFGFTKNNTIMMDGSVAARNVPITSSIAIACTNSPSCHGGINQTISFTIPSSLSPNCPQGSMCPMYMRLVTPGTYKVSVVNDNGTSNTLTLTVTSGTSGNGISISALDAPSSLALSQSGTWTVHVTTTQGNPMLHYAVLWGDEGSFGAQAIKSAESETISTSASFSHSYTHTGSYTPTFTVTDDNGHSVTTSSTVTITPYY